MLNYADTAVIFKAMSDETRLKIMDMLSCDELCACNILENFKITQPTLSYHMKILTDSGLVLARKDGAWTRYRLNPDGVHLIKAFFDAITTDKPGCICKEKRTCN